MILVDHVVGDPVARFTYQSLGFSDALEIFVYLSGLVCGIAYSRTLLLQGWWGLLSTLTRRAVRIYAYYALSSAAIILLATAAAEIWKINGVYLTVANPFIAIASALCLSSPPPIAGILVLYMVLTTVVVPIFLLAGEQYARLALAVSGVIWAVSQFSPSLAGFLTQRWYVNPLAWQFLFSIGMYFGLQWDSAKPTMQLLAGRKWLVPLACAIVAAAFFYRLSTRVAPHVDLDITWMQIPMAKLIQMKENLSPLRLLHFLSVALLVATYIPRRSAPLGWPIASPLVESGKHSLELFSLSVVLSTVDSITVLAYQPSLVGQLALDGIAFFLMALTGFLLSRATNSEKIKRASMNRE